MTEVVDEKKVKILINEILKVESENLKTKKKSRIQMVEHLKKMIEKEVKKCY